MKRLMLISNSFCFGKGYLEHCASAIRTFLGPITQLIFVPYALKDWDRYTEIARDGFAKIGISVTSVHDTKFACHRQAIESARAIFIGGGNTFRLLARLYDKELLGVIREKVTSGEIVYLGVSAGANVACPTIKTTNDMPIVQPVSFGALNLVPFQINPHYIDPDPASKHMGETRDKRIAEFHEENAATVIGLREGSWIRVENGEARLEGETGAKLFSKGITTPTEWGKNCPMNA
jgi:dipeptidase E